jgi:hypothetical protein
LTNGYQAGEFEVVDDIGRLVFEKGIIPDTKQFDIQTTNFPSGLYLGRLISSNGVEEAKIIVRH